MNGGAFRVPYLSKFQIAKVSNRLGRTITSRPLFRSPRGGGRQAHFLNTNFPEESFGGDIESGAENWRVIMRACTSNWLDLSLLQLYYT
jgi:hypothetical protein